MRKVKVISSLNLEGSFGLDVEFVNLSLAKGLASKIGKFIEIVKKKRDLDVLVLNSPDIFELFFVFFLKIILRSKVVVIGFDLILKKPEKNPRGFFSLIVKRRLLSAFDRFVVFHKHTKRYEEIYHINRDKFKYIPFKPNNYKIAAEQEIVDGDYILSLGASQRDYKCLIEAIENLDFKTKIVAPWEALKRHNANLDARALPSHIEHIFDTVSYEGWSELIAKSRFVVVPIQKGTLQPAGVSVYLEAMILKKPVIITEGSSTIGILTSELAVLTPEGDAQALRSAIEQLWCSAEERNKLGENGYRYAKSLQGHERILNDLCAYIVSITGGIGRKYEK